MARCGCAGGAASACTCLVQAGDGMTVSGTGDVDSPYVVSAVPPPATTVSAVDTDTIDTTVTPSGSDYAVSGDVIVSAQPDNILQALPDGLYAPESGEGVTGSLIDAEVGANVASSSEGVQSPASASKQVSVSTGWNYRIYWRATLDADGTGCSANLNIRVDGAIVATQAARIEDTFASYHETKERSVSLTFASTTPTIDITVTRTSPTAATINALTPSWELVNEGPV